MQTATLPIAPAFPLADPAVSANIYCSGRLCEVIERLVAPFWNDYGRGSWGDSYLWVMRYARGGEHLKVRVHALPSEVPVLREALMAAQTGYFSRLSTSRVDPPAKRVTSPSAPPVDIEDRTKEDYPDRIFVWTEYGRSPVSLGYRPYLADDEYSALLTRCLASSTEIVLGRLKSGPEGRSSYRLQRAIWLDALMAGLRSSSFTGADCTLYLVYHRDCLLRYIRKRKRWSDGASAVAQLLVRFDQRAERQGFTKDELARVAEDKPVSKWRGSDIDPWQEAVGDLVAYVTRFQGDPAYQIDPFAEKPQFPVLFKAFHGLANQIGLDPLNEAFLFNLLVGTTAEPELRQRPVRLRPEL